MRSSFSSGSRTAASAAWSRSRSSSTSSRRICCGPRDGAPQDSGGRAARARNDQRRRAGWRSSRPTSGTSRTGRRSIPTRCGISCRRAASRTSTCSFGRRSARPIGWQRIASDCEDAATIAQHGRAGDAGGGGQRTRRHAQRAPVFVDGLRGHRATVDPGRQSWSTRPSGSSSFRWRRPSLSRPSSWRVRGRSCCRSRSARSSWRPPSALCSTGSVRRRCCSSRT